MDAETFNIIVSITLIVLTTAVLAVLAVIIRLAIILTRFVNKVEQKAEKLYSQAMSLERKVFLNAWFWTRFAKSVFSSNFIGSIFRNSSKDRD